MHTSKIQWEGWGAFKDVDDFTDFVKAANAIHFKILWITTDCPIAIWLN